MGRECYVVDNFLFWCWGVRGFILMFGLSILWYGGEMFCFEVCVGDVLVLVDCGFGVCNLGMELY